MSAVGGSDSSKRQDEVVRRTREDAKASEAEMAKRHRKELRRVNEQHNREIANLKQEYESEIANLKKASGDAMSKRDHKFQTDIDKMREMHGKQVQQNAEEAARKEQALRDAMGGDNDREKTRNDDRLEKLSADYTDNIRKKDEQLTEALKASREGQSAGIAANREKLERAHKMELGAVKAERDQTVRELQKTLTDTRETADERIRELQLQRLRANEQASDRLMSAVRTERDARQDSESILREGFESGIENTKDRYERAMAKERQANRLSAQQLKSSTGARIANQISRLERDNEELKDANVRDRVKTKEDKELEIDNLRSAWGKNIERLEEQRQEMLESTNQNNARDIARVHEQKDKQITAAHRDFRARIEENNHLNRAAYENLVGDFEGRTEHLKSTTDKRIKAVNENAAQERARLVEVQQEGHELSQAQHREDLKEQRLALDREKSSIVTNMQNQLRKQELQHSEKMAVVTQKYEKQIQALQAQVLKERKRGEENLKRTVDELQRSHQLTVDQLEAANRERVRQMTNAQAQELRSVNKRNEEKMDAVLTEMKKT